MTTSSTADHDLDIAGIDAVAPDDAAQITDTVLKMFIAFARRDADALAGVYADDTD